MKKRILLLLSGLLIELFYILYRLVDVDPAQTVIKYMVVYAATFIMMVVSFRLLKDQDFSRFFILTVLLFSLIFGLTLVSSPPGQSDDIYRYLWDGKLQYYGISPYTYAPEDPTLKPYHSEQLPKLVNFPHIKTIYPPAAQLFFRLSYTLFGESVAGMKFLFLLVALGSICFFYLILKQKGAEPRWLLFFAWNPLVIMETAVNGHLDILMVFFLLMSLWFFYKNKLIFSGISLACAVLSKLIPVILLPVFFFYFLPLLRGFQRIPGEHKVRPYVHPEILSTVPSVLSVGKKNIFQFFIPLVLTITSFYILYIESAQNMFLTAINYSTKWYFNNPLFLGILSIFRDNATAHMVSFLLFIVLYILLLAGPFALDKKIVFTLGVFVICNPTIHPWYLVILLGLLCIHRSVIVVAWSGLVIFSYIVVYNFKLTGTWKDSWFLLGIEYLPLIILLVIQWYRGRLTKSTATIW